jgi:hypothetical protein
MQTERFQAERAKAGVDAGGIERYKHEIERLVQKGYSPLNIAAALLKNAAEGEGKDCAQRAANMFQNSRINRKRISSKTAGWRN